jgi:hypothetical protein
MIGRYRITILSEWSDGVSSAVPGSNADRLLNVHDEDLAVPDAPRAGRIFNGLDHIVDEAVFDHDLDLHLGQKVDHIFSAPIEFGVPFLTSEPLDLADRDSRDPDVVKRILHVVELERLDDRLNFLHAGAPMNPARLLMPNQGLIWKAVAATK